MPIYTRSTFIAAPPRVVFALHFGSDALARLVPPWESVTVASAPEMPYDGTEARLRVGFGPFKLSWIARHEGFQDRGDQGGEFTDVQIAGPFRSWRHRHVVRPEKDGAVLEDTITYELPFGPLGRIFGGRMTEKKIEKMFEFRHRVTKEAAERSKA